jgi:hypothetical protein
MLYKTQRRTSDNTLAKTNKDKQCYTKHIKERQAIPWPKQQGKTMLYKTHRTRSDITMAKTNKEKQCYIQHTFFYVLSITLFVLVGFAHGIV